MNDAFFGFCVGGCGTSSKWAVAVAAIDAVADGSTPIIANWGLELMSAAADACDAGGVIISPGPTTSAAIRDALANRSTPPGLASPGNRPARAALDAAAANRLGATDLNAQIILLVTDGIPDCKSGEADLLASDADGATRAIADAATAGIRSCVIGLGTAGGPADAPLAQIAAAGLSSCPISPGYVSINDWAGLVATLDAVATQGGGCRYPIPPPPNNFTDPQHIAVFVDGTQIAQDSNNGWSFADGSLRSLVLNGAACDAGQGHTVSVAFRCPLP
jgi:hypothetical protein